MRIVLFILLAILLESVFLFTPAYLIAVDDLANKVSEANKLQLYSEYRRLILAFAGCITIVIGLYSISRSIKAMVKVISENREIEVS